MNSLQRYALDLSRVLVAIIFLLNGLAIVSQAQDIKDLLNHGTPVSMVPFLMLSARTLEVVAGFCLALGIYPRPAVLALLVFLVARLPLTLLLFPFVWF